MNMHVLKVIKMYEGLIKSITKKSEAMTVLNISDYGSRPTNDLQNIMNEYGANIGALEENSGGMLFSIDVPIKSYRALRDKFRRERGYDLI